MRNKLDDLKVYQLAINIGETVWKTTEIVDPFSKRSIGLQLVRAADSMSANISEGYDQ
jgi:four helix bundle protein